MWEICGFYTQERTTEAQNTTKNARFLSSMAAPIYMTTSYFPAPDCLYFAKW